MKMTLLSSKHLSPRGNKTGFLRPVLFLLSFLVFSPSVRPQSAADVKLSQILNSGDLLLLEEQYPLLKDSVEIGMLRWMAEAQLGVGLNRLEEAAVALDSLLQRYRESLDAQTSLALASLQAMNLLNLGQYSTAGEAGEQLVNALKGSVPFESLYSLIFIERMGKSLADVPPASLSRPAHEVTVPMKVVAAGRGQHLHIPVQVNGLTSDFIFDTGCSFGNFVTEDYARRAGLTILADSLPVAGATIGYVKVATADSLIVGELTLHHPIFLVAPPDPEADSVFSYEGVLGHQFIRLAGEIVLDNESHRFVFSTEPSEGTPDMYLSSNVPQVRIEYADTPFDITFDSGNVKSNLDSRFSGAFPEAVAGLSEQSTQHGGFGGIVHMVSVTLPEFRFHLSGTPVVLEQVEVVRNNGGSQFLSGSLGADFALAFKRLSINYKNMFLRGE